MLGGSSAREAETAQFGRFRQRDAKVEVFSRALRRWAVGRAGGAQLFRGPAGGRKELTGVVRDGGRQTEPEKLAEGDGLKAGMGTAREVTNSVEPFDG